MLPSHVGPSLTLSLAMRVAIKLFFFVVSVTLLPEEPRRCRVRVLWILANGSECLAGVFLRRSVSLILMEVWILLRKMSFGAFLEQWSVYIFGRRCVQLKIEKNSLNPEKLNEFFKIQAILLLGRKLECNSINMMNNLHIISFQY